MPTNETLRYSNDMPAGGARQPSRGAIALELALGGLAVVASFAGAVVVLGVLVGPEPPSWWQYWVRDLAALLPVFAWLRKFDFGLRRAPWKAYGWSLALLPLVIWHAVDTGFQPIAALGWMATVPLVLAPAVEEMLFRGWLWGGLGRIAPFWAQLSLTTLLFTISHGDVALFHILSGLALGYIRWRHGSVWPCMALHATINVWAALAGAHLA